MKFLIFSDIHGDASSARFIARKYDEVKPDKIIILGDILYHGPRNDLPENYYPKEVIKELNALGDHIIAVRGNCEAEVDQMVLSFPCLSETGTIFADGNTLFLTHGHIYSREKRPGSGYTHFLSGHTHINVLEKEGGIVFLNPGSISIPKNGCPRSYAAYEDGRIRILRMEDDSVIKELS